MTSPARSPAALVVARVLAVLQLGAALAATAVGGLLVTASGGPAANGFAVTAGAAVLVVAVGGGLLLGVPLLVLRGSSPTRRVTGRGLLTLGELAWLVPPLVVVGVRSGTVVPLGADRLSLLLDLLLLTPLVVVACLLTPAVGRWADPGRAGARDVSSL